MSHGNYSRKRRRGRFEPDALDGDGTAPSAQQVLPDSRQLALFQTILAGDLDFGARWNSWISEIANDLDMDSASFQNLSLLHKRTPSKEVDTDRGRRITRLIQDSYRGTWIRNHFIFRNLKSSLEVLHQAGVKTLVLKGAALVNRYYNDMGMRSMGDVDILVPPSQFLRAAEVLIASGWNPVFKAEDFDAQFDHALQFEDGKDQFLDLHVHVLHMTPMGDADSLFWSNAIPISFGGVQTLTLCDADQILHLAEHGMHWVPCSPFRWVADIAFVISHGDPDWERLLWMSRRLHKSLAVSTALGYLVQNRLAALPDWVLPALSNIPVDEWERSDFEINARDTLGSFRLAVRSHWHRMNQARYGLNLLSRLMLLPAYIRFCAKRSGHRSRLSYLFDFNIVKRHLAAKQRLVVKNT